MNDLVLTLLAEGPNRGPDYGKASPVGLFIVVLLLIGLFVLIRSMNRHLRKVPPSFGATEAAPEWTVSVDTVAETTTEGEAPPRESSG